MNFKKVNLSIKGFEFEMIGQLYKYMYNCMLNVFRKFVIDLFGRKNQNI